MGRQDALSINDPSLDKIKPIDLLIQRASALKLTEPGPTQEQVEIILKAAVTAADHGRIRPWRFVVMRGEGRKRLGDLMADAQRAIQPEISEEALEKVRAKAMRAPLVIALVCQANTTHKVPLIEQQLATGAAGAHLMLAAKALGFGSSWKTGTPAYDPAVRTGLGFGPDDSVVGFFYIGTELQTSPLARASIESVVQYWND